MDTLWNNEFIIDEEPNFQISSSLSNNNLIKLELFESNLSSDISKDKKMSLLIVVLLQMIFGEQSDKLEQIYAFLNKKNILDIDVTKNNYAGMRSNLSFMIETLNKNNKLDNRYRNNYNQINLLGQGSYGSVYKVFHKFEKKMYALKKIFITEDLFDIFKEVQIYSNLEHPNIVKYYSSWVDIDIASILEYNKTIDINDDEPIQKLCPILFIQMELCDTTFKEYMLSTMIDDPIEIRINYFNQIIEGVNYLHDNNIIHRDLKPDNIFLIKNKIKIGDFGLCTNTDTYIKITNSNELSIYNMSDDVATGIYMAPEIPSKHYNNLIDIYSLGIILLELLLNYSTMHEKFTLIRNIKNNINSNIPLPNMLTNKYDSLIKSMISPNINDRPKGHIKFI